MLFLCIVSLPCLGASYIVDDDGPADFDNIQDAVNYATNGDTIILQEGVYQGTGNRNIDFLGKAIVVKGTDPNNPVVIANTVIDCQGISGSLRRGFYFHSGETRSSTHT